MLWAIPLALIAAVLAWRFFSHLLINRGLVVGPWINGKTRSPGYPRRVKRVGAGWKVQLAPDKELSAVLDYGFRIPAGATALRFHFDAAIVQARPTEAPDRPALVSLVLQRKGDDWSAQGDKASYRLYSPAYPLETGVGTITIPLKGWTNVWGQPADMAPVIANLSNLAVAFGHAGGRMHGVSGEGVFTLISLEAV